MTLPQAHHLADRLMDSLSDVPSWPPDPYWFTRESIKRLRFSSVPSVDSPLLRHYQTMALSPLIEVTPLQVYCR